MTSASKVVCSVLHASRSLNWSQNTFTFSAASQSHTLHKNIYFVFCFFFCLNDFFQWKIYSFSLICWDCESFNPICCSIRPTSDVGVMDAVS